VYWIQLAQNKVKSFVTLGNVVIGISKEDCTVNVAGCESSTLRQLLRCYRELLVINLIKNILDFDFLCSSWLTTEASRQLICPIFIGQAVKE
jgi:hypothetical protein